MQIKFKNICKKFVSLFYSQFGFRYLDYFNINKNSIAMKRYIIEKPTQDYNSSEGNTFDLYLHDSENKRLIKFLHSQFHKNEYANLNKIY